MSKLVCFIPWPPPDVWPQAVQVTEKKNSFLKVDVLNKELNLNIYVGLFCMSDKTCFEKDHSFNTPHLEI